jgi:hypothetical protein
MAFSTLTSTLLRDLCARTGSGTSMITFLVPSSALQRAPGFLRQELANAAQIKSRV